MSSYIGTRGLPLPVPAASYPATIQNRPTVVFGGQLSVMPGGEVLLPPGVLAVRLGKYTVVQVKDPVTQAWMLYDPGEAGDTVYVDSDGENYRVFNPTGFPVGAQVNAAGTGYTSAPTVTADVGGSTWQAVVGGGVSAINLTSGGGSGFAVAPVVNIAAPPAPGVQATAVAAISGGVVTAFTITNPGAGYTSAPTVTLVPQPDDLNAGTLVMPAQGVTAQLSYVGTVMAVLPTNHGSNPLPTPPALSITGGGGSGATATAVMALTVTGVAITTPGSGYSTPVEIRTTGGYITSAAAATNNGAVSTDLFLNRDAKILATTGSGTGVGLPLNPIKDGGFFQHPPTAYATPGPKEIAGAISLFSGFSASAVVSLTMGGANDTVWIQPL